MSLSVQGKEMIPDYEDYDYSKVWRGRGIEDRVEKEVVARWATGETGIDLGGGFGRITRVLETRIGKMFMLDYSLGNLRRAASRLERTTLVRGTLERLPFHDSVFDFVALVRVIHHVPDPDPVLAEVVRVARDGGTFVLGVANETDKGRPGEDALVRVTPEGHRIYATPLGRYVRAGLERVEVLGVGAFDNRIGRRVERLAPLATLDLATSRLWPAKSMLFARYRVRKAVGKGEEPRVRCPCGGAMTAAAGRCERCGRHYGQIVDVVEDRP